jgi:hypothetical protein
MALLTEIADAFAGATERRQVTGAVLDTAKVIRNEGGGVPDHAERLVWAKKAALSPLQMAERMHGAVITDSGVSAEIPGISDATLLTAVDALVLNFSDTNLPEL